MSEKEIKKEKKEMLEFGKYLTDSLKEVDDYFYEDNKNSEEKGFVFYVYVKGKSSRDATIDFWKRIDKKNSENLDVRYLEYESVKEIFENSKKWEQLKELLK